MIAKSQGIARQVFQPTGNSVALSGSDGMGQTSSDGLDASKLHDIGVLFLSKQDSTRPIGMIDVGGYLELIEDNNSRTWTARESKLDAGVLRILSRSYVEDVRIL